MQIPKPIAKRIAKFTKIKPEFQTPFVQGEYEYLTNTIFMVKADKQIGQKEDDRRVPQMETAIKMNMPDVEQSTRFTTDYLLDILNILKANGSKYVDIKIGLNSVYITGLESSFGTPNCNNMTALLMYVSK